jgi:hypothetical protein
MTGGIAASAAEQASDPLAAVAEATPQSLANAAQVPTISSGSYAINATIDGTKVVVPIDPAAGIQVGSKRGQASIGLPFAGGATTAAAESSGVVSYNNNNGSSTVPIVRNDGSVQINTVILNPAAPSRFEYPITVPSGQSLHLTPDGAVYAAASTGVPSLYIAAPWAKDAKGSAVPTHYEINGNVLTQVVDFTVSTAFPVVADPTILATGQYDYNCVATNGSSYFIAHGTALNTCHGSRLQKYINGSLVQTIPLTGYGAPGNPAAFGTAECYISLASAALSIYGPGWLVRFLSGAIGYVVSAGLPSITSCKG